MSKLELSVMTYVLALLAVLLMVVVSYIQIVRIRQYEDIIRRYEAMPLIMCPPSEFRILPSVPNFDGSEG